MPSLSYREKSLYGELLADLAVFVPYFIYIHIHHPTMDVIAAAITLLILARILLQAVIALATRNRLKDERDRLIRLRAYRVGYLTIIGLMLFGTAAIWLHTALNQINPAHMALHFFSVFIAILMLAEVVKTIAQIVAYRRSV